MTDLLVVIAAFIGLFIVLGLGDAVYRRDSHGGADGAPVRDENGRRKRRHHAMRATAPGSSPRPRSL
jgi:hypothetical protein